MKIMKKTILFLMATILCLAFTACSDNDSLPKAKFSEITISPMQQTYHVGDKVTLTVKQATDTPSEVKAAKYEGTEKGSLLEVNSTF